MNNLYSWSYSNDKNRWWLWYVIALSIVIWLVIWWFLNKQYILWFLVILIAWVYFFVENNQDEQTNVEIQELGIKINSSFYEYTKIISFYVIYEWEYAKMIRLNLNKKWVKIIDIEIDNNIAKDIIWPLQNYIQIDESWELNFTDKLIRIFKL